MAGKRDDCYTTEFYQNGNFTSGPDLPPDSYATYPCATQVTDDLTFYGGGTFSYLYSHSAGEFQIVKALFPAPHYGAACGSATMADASRVVVVAGGSWNTFLKSVFILDISTNKWTEGPELPYNVTRATVVPTEDSFLLVGGYNVDPFDTILEFDPINMAWFLREETLAIGRHGFWVIDVDEERFCE